MKSIKNYLEIEKILQETKGSNEPIMITRDVLSDMFRSIQRSDRQLGILGFTEDWKPIFNDIGMVPVIRSVAREEFADYGEPKSVTISRKANDLYWVAELIFSTPTGDIHITQTYRLSYLREKRQFEFQLP